MPNPEIWWKSIFLGLVQGVTEFLPISSSGHLIAAKEVLQCEEAGLAFDVSLHLATLLAVVIYFRREILQIIWQANRWKIFLLVILATIPGAALGAVLGEWREHLQPVWVVVGWMFSATYLLFTRGKNGTQGYAAMPLGKGLLIGSAQALAIFPGVSRSGSSIASALWLGLEQDAACRFSFLISIPLIAGAGLEEGIKLSKAELEHMGGWGPLIAGMAFAFTVGILAIHLLLKAVRRNRIHLFGWYNLAAAVFFGFFLLLR